MAEIRVQNLHKAFADFVAVRGSTFTVPDGDFFCLLGPSCCGKTTALKTINGLVVPDEAQVDGGAAGLRDRAEQHRAVALPDLAGAEGTAVLDELVPGREHADAGAPDDADRHVAHARQHADHRRADLRAGREEEVAAVEEPE